MAAVKALMCLVLASLSCRQCYSQQPPIHFANDLLECVQTTPINTCLRETLNDLRPLMTQGIPELGLQRTEPLEIDNLRFVTKPGIGVQVESEFQDVLVRGLSQFETRLIDADLNTRTLKIAMYVPKIEIDGNYKARGKVLIIDNIEGDGRFNATLHRVLGSGSAQIVPVGPVGDQKLSVRNTVIDFNIGNANVHLDNLFDGNLEAIAASVNQFLNEHNQIIINEVKPQIREEVRTLVESVLNSAFSKLPVDQYLEKIPRELRRSGRRF